MQQKRTLNVTRIRELMDQGFRALKAQKASRQAVLVIGDTGVGKSTIISLLAGVKLVVKHNGLNTVIDSADNSTKVKIGHQKYSQTTIPTKIVIDDIDFFDCSGFRDNRGDQFEISNSFFLQRLFYLYEKVKILLIIDEHYISQARLDKLPKLIHSLGDAFGSVKSIQNGVVLLINRAKINRDLKDYSAQIERLANLKGEKPLFNAEEKSFLSYLVQNKRLILFKQAAESQAGKPLNVNSAQIIEPIKNSSFIKNQKIKNIISESAKLSIRDFADELLAQGEYKFDDFIRKIKQQFSKQKGVVKTVQQSQETLSNVQNFIQGLKKCDDNTISQYLKTNIPNLNDGSIGKDISTMLFLRQIYEKSNTYFTILKHKLISQLILFKSEVQEQLTYLRKKQEEILQLKNKQIQLQNQLKAQAQQRQRIKLQSQEYKTAIKNKQKHLQEFKDGKEKQIQTLKKQFQAEKKNAERLLSERQEELKSFQKDQSIKFNEFNQKVSQQQNMISTLQKYESQSKEYLSKVQEEKTFVHDQLQSLRARFQKLRIDYDEKIQEIEEMNVQNESLRNEIQNFEKMSVAQSSLSMASKSSKYPDVVCPHFKNGGKCKHCIRKWKQSQKLAKTQV